MQGKKKEKKTEKKKSANVRKSILEIVPVRELSEKGFYRLDDNSYMDILQIQSKDLINSSEDEVSFDCLKFAKLYRLYADDLKIVCINFPCDYSKQKRFLEYKLKNTRNEIFKENLQKKLNELIWLEKNNTEREYYYMIFADSEENMEKNKRSILSVLGGGRGGLISEISQDKKIEILFRIMNKSFMV